MQCNKLGSGRCVLIGDAAHNTPATIGTGAASALQDTAILADVADQLLEASKSTETTAFAEATPAPATVSQSAAEHESAEISHGVYVNIQRSYEYSQRLRMHCASRDTVTLCATKHWVISLSG